MPQPDTPRYVEVGASACHEMPTNNRVSDPSFRRSCVFVRTTTRDPRTGCPTVNQSLSATLSALNNTRCPDAR